MKKTWHQPQPPPTSRQGARISFGSHFGGHAHGMLTRSQIKGCYVTLLVTWAGEQQVSDSLFVWCCLVSWLRGCLAYRVCSSLWDHPTSQGAKSVHVTKLKLGPWQYCSQVEVYQRVTTNNIPLKHADGKASTYDPVCSSSELSYYQLLV